MPLLFLFARGFFEVILYPVLFSNMYFHSEFILVYSCSKIVLKLKCFFPHFLCLSQICLQESCRIPFDASFSSFHFFSKDGLFILVSLLCTCSIWIHLDLVWEPRGAQCTMQVDTTAFRSCINPCRLLLAITCPRSLRVCICLFHGCLSSGGSQSSCDGKCPIPFLVLSSVWALTLNFKFWIALALCSIDFHLILTCLVFEAISFFWVTCCLFFWAGDSLVPLGHFITNSSGQSGDCGTDWGESLVPGNLSFSTDHCNQHL